MRISVKASIIYERLRKEILEHHYLPGQLLPREKDLASQLCVSVGTLRKALELLAQESLIRHTAGHGNYVSESIAEKKITFLLPCYSEPSTNFHFLKDIYTGVFDAGMRARCKLETIPISRTNDPDDIDWGNLFNLGADDRVIVCGVWFQRLYPFLKERGCRVAVVVGESKFEVALRETYPEWIVLRKRARELTRRMTMQLLRRGCNHPAFLLNYLETADFFASDIRSVCATVNPAIEPVMMQVPMDMTEEKADMLVHKSLSQKPVDGILVNHPEVLRSVHRVFPELICGVFDLPAMPGITGEKYCDFFSSYDHASMGADAVTLLLKDDKGVSFEYDAELHDS